MKSLPYQAEVYRYIYKIRKPVTANENWKLEIENIYMLYAYILVKNFLDLYFDI